MMDIKKLVLLRKNYGFDDFLPIFSGTKAGTLLAKRIIDEIGSDDPNLWIPIFLEKIKESKNF